MYYSNQNSYMMGDSSIEEITVVELSVAKPSAATTLATIKRQE